MDPSSLQHHHHQEIMESQSLDSMLMCTKGQNQLGEQQQQQQEKKPRPAEEALKCPRCDSSNTKFCYYNNYSLTQPRYFCKSCRRYWTKGGTLRNVPVGGGCRKNKRSSSTSRRITTLDHHHHHQPHHLITNSTPTSSSSHNSLLISSPPPSSYDHHHSTNDLTLAFARLQKQVSGSMGFDQNENQGNISLLGNHQNPHFNLFGNADLQQQYLYYNGLAAGGNDVNDHHHQMGMQFDHHHHHHHDQHHDHQQEMMSNASSGSSTPTGSASIKQELMVGDHQNRLLWGLPWQLNSGANNHEGMITNYMNGSNGNINGGNEIDSLRESWNNVGALGPASWHSLINSPLM